MELLVALCKGDGGQEINREGRLGKENPSNGMDWVSEIFLFVTKQETTWLTRQKYQTHRKLVLSSRNITIGSILIDL